MQDDIFAIFEKARRMSRSDCEVYVFISFYCKSSTIIINHQHLLTVGICSWGEDGKGEWSEMVRACVKE